MLKKLLLLFKNAKKSPIFAIIFTLIIAFGIFLRIYNFAPWLHFEVDQTWDYNIVSQAITGGISNLPLLGPTAGGGRALRLGPAFYYMEYLSARIFGNTPVGHATLVLILSILSLPLFYFFSRKYFSKTISLGILIIFSFSFYLVMYGRFSWSPNVLPFFVMLSLYTLLKSVSSKEKYTGRWFLLAVVSLTVSSQIHFNAFFALSAVAVLFLLIKKPHFNKKTWVAAVGIVILLYVPMIANEIKTRGENSYFFLEKVDKNASHAKPFIEKGLIDIQFNAYEYFLILTGNDQINNPEQQPGDYTLGLGCGKTCTSHIPIRTLALLIFFGEIVLLLKNLRKEKDEDRKNFLIIIALWLSITFCYYFAIYSSNILFPRFFLIVSPLAVILFGLILEWINPKKNRTRAVIFIAIIFVFVFSNTREELSYFSSLRDVSNRQESIFMKDVFPDHERVTLELQEKVASYMASKYAENKFPIYLQADHEYEPSFWYQLNKYGIQYYDSVNEKNIYSQSNYFIVMRSYLIDKKTPQEIQKHFEIVETKSFGSLTVFYLKPNSETITNQRQAESDKKETLEAEQISEIETWHKLFFEPYTRVHLQKLKIFESGVTLQESANYE